MQEKEIERVGGTHPFKVNIRVVAATHRDLDAMVTRELFRNDLYFRLQVFPLTIPPLRERRGDIPALVSHFLEKKQAELGLRTKPVLAFDAMEQLMAYNWPGNVRELENAVERAMILCQGRLLSFDGIVNTSPVAVQKSEINQGICSGSTSPANFNSLDQTVILHIIKALELTGGQIGGEKGAAVLLGVNPSTLRKKMRKFKIPFGRDAKHRYTKR